MSALPATRAPVADLDVEAIRRDFPVLERVIHGRPLSYLDNAASSQRPRAVIDAMSRYYETSHANVHRGVHTLSQEATDLFEGAREKVRRFINARSTREIIFVRGTTEAINLVAQTYGRRASARATRSWSRGSSTTPISCRGRCCASRPARRSRSPRSRSPAKSTSTRSPPCSPRARSWSRSRMSRTRSAPSSPCSASSRPPARAACRCCWTVRRPCRT